ncbi:MAG: ABC transporter permease [Treponema sp.]|nr:ABC transporter permease [Treponema sp.]
MSHYDHIIHSAVTIMTPLLLAATGGLFTELAGMLNIALEGMLLISAFTAVTAVYYTGSVVIGIAAAIISSMILAGLLASVTLRLKSNVFITGLAANLFAAGITVVLSHYFFATRGVVVLKNAHRLTLFDIPVIENIPVLSDIFSGHSFYVYLSWLLLFIAAIVIYKTPFGYRLRACGRHSQALVSLGLNPDLYRYIAFLISGFACGIGGSFLSLNLGVFVPNMSSGKGWIALVVIFLGSRKPQNIIAAAFVFGLIDSFSNYAQGLLNIPADFILAIPYIFTLLMMIGVSIHEKMKNKVM